MTLTKTMLGALAATLLTGCSANSKFVTTVHEYNDQTFYLAYTDFTKSMMGLSSSFTAHVRKCDRQPDRSVVCTEQEDLNKLLNAENQRK